MRAITFDIETRTDSFTRGKIDIATQELTIVGIHDSETNEYSSYSVEELSKLWPIIERADMLIGFNSDAFDIPILNRYYAGDLTNIRSLDIMVEVQKVLGRRVRLQSLGEATLKRGKTGNGAEAMTWWEQGLHDKVRKYCIEDVRLTRDLYDYAREHGHLKYKDFKEKKTVALDTSRWETDSSAPSLTHTLGI
jgi:DEAD/DEAH box helicase domain-containing protein